MTTLAPLFCDPEYEQPEDGCELQARWPNLVGAARSSALVSELPVFYEWAPLPGGLLLAGVGHAKAPTDAVEPSLRETILARMLAGHPLDESVRRALVETGAEQRGGSVCYALVDPDRVKVQVVREGAHASSILLVRSSTHAPYPTPLLRAGVKTLEIRKGDALLLVAHADLWERHVTSAIARHLAQDEQWDERTALQLAGRIGTVLTGDSASVLLYRRVGDGPDEGFDPSSDLWSEFLGP